MFTLLENNVSQGETNDENYYTKDAPSCADVCE